MTDVVMPRWWPTCSRCRGPVTRCAVTVDPKTVSYRVECHDEVRTLVVPRLRINNAMGFDPWKDEVA